VGFAGVVVDRRCGLGSKVSNSGIKIERADTVLAVRASELHAALDALDSIGFHYMNCKSSASYRNVALVGHLR
jgi:hypothetical protein